MLTIGAVASRCSRKYHWGVKELAAADAAWKRGDLATASQLWQRVVAFGSPGDQATARLRLARAWSAGGDFVRALAETQHVLREHPSARVSALQQLVALLWQADLRDGARAAWARLLEAEPAAPMPEQVTQIWQAAGPRNELLLGRYRLLRSVGQGTGGHVFLARDEVMQRDVAIKALHARPGDGGVSSSSWAACFREADLMRAAHPHIVQLFDSVPSEGLLVMERTSHTLAEALARGPLDGATTRRVAVGIASALHELHAQGVLHRDVAPANIHFDSAGDAKLADFGHAHLQGAAVTQTDGVGTLAYTAPELLRGQSPSAASDVYALSAVLYECATGQWPYGTAEQVTAHLQREPEPLPETIPPQWRSAIIGLLNKDPVARMQQWEQCSQAWSRWPAWERPAIVSPPVRVSGNDIQWAAPKGTHWGHVTLGSDSLGRALIRETYDASDEGNRGWGRAKRLAPLGALGAAFQRAVSLDVERRAVVWQRPTNGLLSVNAAALSYALRAQLLDALQLLAARDVAHGRLGDALYCAGDVLWISSQAPADAAIDRSPVGADAAFRELLGR